MTVRWLAKKWWGLLAAGGVGAACLGWWWSRPPSGDPSLRPCVHDRPPVPVVFTSRSEPASFQPAAPPGEGYVYPGQPLWQAREGRLRLLTPGGEVLELTWGKSLPDGGTLIDVMGPSVSPDGARVVFAGRRGPPDHGRFRLYEIGIHGRRLRQLTGGPDDEGCTALPPLRYRAPDDRSLLSDDERRRVDYDDVDPGYLGDGSIVFASSRHPDLGRGHSRRATNLWVMKADGSGKHSVTSNRNNDRWPFLMLSNYLAFSLWSRNTEVLTADLLDIRPWEPGLACATHPTNSWLGAVLLADGSRLGSLVKPPVPVWRPRPLFNGRIVFMTPADDHAGSGTPDHPGPLQVVQAEIGLMHNAPSSRPVAYPLPRQADYQLFRGPPCDAQGQRLSLATPGPCPGGGVVLSGAPLDGTDKSPSPGRYGLYLAGDAWPSSDAPSAEAVELRLLFDDPDLVDAEPVAVYARPVLTPRPAAAGGAPPAPARLKMNLAGDRYHSGPVGYVASPGVYLRQNEDMPGQTTDTGAGPIFEGPPPGTIDHLKVYASRRDRFDDPQRPRVPGAWELLLQVPVKGRSGTFDTALPVGTPTVLAAFTREGKVARWTTAAKDSEGRQATFYAFAGDHYSGTRPAHYEFCVGCHPGHSNPGIKQHGERLR